MSINPASPGRSTSGIGVQSADPPQTEPSHTTHPSDTKERNLMAESPDAIQAIAPERSILEQLKSQVTACNYKPTTALLGTVFYLRSLGPKKGWTNGMPPNQPRIRPSDKEKQSNELYAQLLFEALLKLANEEGAQRILAVLNSKGGAGKTPLSAELAVVLYAALQAQIMLIDANENRGGTADALGVPMKATIRYALRNRELFRTFEGICKHLIKSNEYGVYLLASDAHGVRDIPLWDFVSLLLDLKQYGGHSMVGDCGNGNDSPTNLGMAVVATNLIISLMEDDPQSYKDALSTMWEHVLMGREDKVRNALIVVNATKPDATKTDIVRKLQEAAAVLWVKGTRENPDISHQVKLGDFDISEDNIFLVPYSQYIKDRQPASADPQKIGLKTLIAYLEILVAAFSQEINYTWQEIDVQNRHEPGNTLENRVQHFNPIEDLEMTRPRAAITELASRGPVGGQHAATAPLQHRPEQDMRVYGPPSTASSI